VSMTNPADRVEIITSVQRRRRWTASEKVRIVEETLEPGMTVSLVARRHGVAPNLLGRRSQRRFCLKNEPFLSPPTPLSG
jgi:transposase-like protein